jgi:hypothetical protein
MQDSSCEHRNKYSGSINGAEFVAHIAIIISSRRSPHQVGSFLVTAYIRDI